MCVDVAEVDDDVGAAAGAGMCCCVKKKNQCPSVLAYKKQTQLVIRYIRHAKKAEREEATIFSQI